MQLRGLAGRPLEYCNPFGHSTTAWTNKLHEKCVTLLTALFWLSTKEGKVCPAKRSLRSRARSILSEEIFDFDMVVLENCT